LAAQGGKNRLPGFQIDTGRSTMGVLMSKQKAKRLAAHLDGILHPGFPIEAFGNDGIG
jgi:hypothetical protein